MAGRLLVSDSSAERRAHAAAFVTRQPAAAETLLIGATRGAADDLAREIARVRPATFGLHRFSLTQLAARLAATRLAGQGLTPATGLGTTAVAARAVFEAQRSGTLPYFAPVADMPGFPASLARTLTDLRMAAAAHPAIRSAGESGPDLAALSEGAAAQFQAGGAADRATLFATALEALTGGRPFCRGCPVVLLDVPLDSEVEVSFVRALLAQAREWVAVVPAGDDRAAAALGTMSGWSPQPTGDRPVGHEAGQSETTLGGSAGAAAPATAREPNAIHREIEAGEPEPEASQGPHPVAGSPQPDSDLSRLRRFLFSSEEPPARAQTGDVVFFSAPGEGREAVEIARYALDEARRGVRFDEVAVFLRSPREYLGLVEHAFARAGIPVWLGRGTRRPHPAGRALLALMSCADENLSAHRFAEYLSLAQVPAVSEVEQNFSSAQQGAAQNQPPQKSRAKALLHKQPSLFDPEPIRPLDDALATGAERLARGDLEPREPDVEQNSSSAHSTDVEQSFSSAHSSPADVEQDFSPAQNHAGVLQGTIRAPYKWEEWLNESAVIAGRDRWHRLDGLAAEYRLKLKEARRDDPGSSKTAAIERDLSNLEHLRAFALPLIDEFAAWPAEATWREWLDRLETLVPRVIRHPLLVQRVLAELRPMGAIGPVTLREVRDVLSERLRSVAVEPPDNRYGRVFVGTTDQARGRAFRVVFVPGLAERVFPQKLREDPLLGDEARRSVDPALRLREERSAEERLLLKLAVGAATDRVYLSYPRIELREARARVPSFYGLDVVRAVTGRVPGHEELQADAARETKTTLAWPAPIDAVRAVDDVEYDLAVLAPLLRTQDQSAVKGHARYLLDLNEHLRRSLTERWQRWKPAWTASDGLVKKTELVAAALADQRLAARPYSLTALQRYAACPYQFLLQAIYRLEPFEEPTPLQRLDPLTKGGLFHEIQAAFFRERQKKSALPITRDNLAESLEALDAAVALVSDKERELLAPAVDRVWRDEIAAIRKDLRRWVMLQAEDHEWTPERFELSFGLEIDPDHDPHSVREEVTVAGRFRLRGSIDLVERHGVSRTLRVTDHKTGKNRTEATTTVNGGKTLQPVLYSAVVEQMTGETVAEGRLYYCTEAGKFTHHTVPLDAIARKTGLQALEIVDRGIELAFLAASPDEGACKYCDYRPVCGPREEYRAGMKNRGSLADLLSLRGLP